MRAWLVGFVFVTCLAACQDGPERTPPRSTSEATAEPQPADEGVTPLLRAVVRGEAEVAGQLIDAGADPDASGWLTKRAVIEAGVAVEIPAERFEATPLMMATLRGDRELVDVLLHHGAAVDASTAEGMTPLFVAVFRGDGELVQHLLRSGADPNRVLVQGVTPLLAAVEQEQFDIVERLLGAGARPDDAAGDGRSPLQVALARGHAELGKLLQRYGAERTHLDDSAVVDTVGFDPRAPAPEEVPLWALRPSRVGPLGVVVSPETGRVYWTEYATGRVRSADRNGGDVRTVVRDLVGPIGLAIDEQRQALYWTADASYPRAISQFGLDGSGVTHVVRGPAVNRPRAIAVNGLRGEVVWTEAVSGRIIRRAADGTVEQLYSSGISSTADREDGQAFRSLGLAIDERGGRVYWTDVASGRIRRGDMAGVSVDAEMEAVSLIDAPSVLEFPSGIALDAKARRLYWTDLGRQEISLADLDGQGVTPILERGDGLVAPYGLALDEQAGKIYWTDSVLDVIGRADLDGSSVEFLDLLEPAGWHRPLLAADGSVRSATAVAIADATHAVAVCLQKVDALKAVKRSAADAARAAALCGRHLRRYAGLVRAMGQGQRATVERVLALRYLRAAEWLEEVRPFLAAYEGGGEAVAVLDDLRERLAVPAAGRSSGPLPTSGQTTSYTAVYGKTAERRAVPDDGASQFGRRKEFRDNGDGTLTDLHTGLTWEKKCDGCGGAHDMGLELPWTGSGGDQTVWDWLAALNGVRLGGHADWRLPNVKELQSIVDYERFNPAVLRVFDGYACGLGCSNLADPDCSCTQMTPYWTSTTLPAAESHALVVTFNLGLIAPVPKAEMASVRAVRGGGVAGQAGE